jgi:hypothetical protein
MKGLSVEPSQRQPDARTMAMELEAIIAREGCEPLESYVERELAAHREAQEMRTRAILTGQPLPEIAQVVKPVHPGTLDDDGPIPEREEATEPHGELSPPVTAPVEKPVPQRTVRAKAAVIGAVLLAVLGVFVLARQGSDPEPEPEPEPIPPITRESKPIEKKLEALEPEVMRAEPIVLPEERAPIEKRAVPSRRRVKKAPPPKKPARKISKPVPEDGIMTEW